MDFDPVIFDPVVALTRWGFLCAVLVVLAMLLGLALSYASGGAQGGGVFLRGIRSLVSDLTSISPRRVLALAGLTLKEATRRKALLVFVVFAALLMFAGWFLNSGATQADRVHVHITFMLTTISWLILPVIMFLSCWSIPEDIRIRSLHTVVTKPARRVEVVIGRILGFSTMSTVLLLLMGAIGYVWIQRQVPSDVKDRLTCRVPVYGQMYFIDDDGLPRSTGVNVGDAWLYRSFIQGNSRQRAVWVFGGVTPEAIGGDLKLESRFEAFRTVKGTEDSIRGGLEAQYTLVRNMRESAFALLGRGVSFRPASEAMRAGNFATAADELAKIADRVEETPDEFPFVECSQVGIAARQAGLVLKQLGDEFSDVSEAFETFGLTAKSVRVGASETYGPMAEACRKLADILDIRGLDLLEKMPRVEVPLETFHISEFHEGDDSNSYPRNLTYVADYESTARFLAEVVGQANEQEKTVADGGLSPTFVETLEAAEVAPANAQLVSDVLAEELEAGALQIVDNKLSTVDESRWLQFFDKLVHEERLLSVDPAGWVLTADLFDDLAPNGALQVQVSCLNDEMYLGMARADMFVRLPDNSFLAGFLKTLLSIGLMLSLVVVIAVTASCVVKGPVAFFFTLTVFVIGQFFHSLMLGLVEGAVEGGGLLESAVLMVQHRAPGVGIDANEGTQKLVQTFDSGTAGVLQAASTIIPDFTLFSSASAYIENGFDVPWNSSVLPAITTFIGFLIPCVIIGAVCLKFRELESK